jgi:hypothetical protein
MSGDGGPRLVTVAHDTRRAGGNEPLLGDAVAGLDGPPGCSPSTGAGGCG